MSYGDAKKWTLLNNFTILEDKMLRDRPFMRTCVPHRLTIDLYSPSAVDHTAWPSRSDDQKLTLNEKDELVLLSDGKDIREYRTDRRIVGRGRIEKDTIEVFSMSSGFVGRFNELKSLTIRSAGSGRIGGHYNAGPLDGIGFSGMSSKAVPASGFMAGEIGGLYFTDGRYEDSGKGAPSLNAELYVDQAAMDRIFEAVTRPSATIDKITLSVIVELFEDEVQSSLSEPWMSKVFGLLSQDKENSFAAARARIEDFLVTYVINNAHKIDNNEEDVRSPTVMEAATNDNDAATLIVSPAHKNQQLLIIIGLLAAILATLIIR